MKKVICVLLISLLVIGCQNSKQLFSEKKVVMVDQIIEFPMALSEFIELTNADPTFRGGSVLDSRDYVVLTTKDFQIGVYNDGKTEKALEDCVVIGTGDRLEIWSQDDWNGFFNSNKDNMSDIAENLFNESVNL